MDQETAERQGFEPPKFLYDVKVALKFTKPEVDLLMQLSAAHYDWHCREVGQKGGFLMSIKSWNEQVVGDHILGFREIDTLAKICEQGQALSDEAGKIQAFGLRIRFMRLLNEINAEVRRLNPKE